MTALTALTAASEPFEAGQVFGAGHALDDGQPLDDGSAALASRIDAKFLGEAGWDPVCRVLTIDPAHPLLGRRVCRAPGCQTTCGARTGLCLDCRRRLAGSGVAVQDYLLLPPPHGVRWLRPGDGVCSVPGCPRPWVGSADPLCGEHLDRQRGLGVDVAEFAALPDVIPLPSLGVCAVVACPRQLPAADVVYCQAHSARLRGLRRAGRRVDELRWRATEPPVARAGQVSLAGLAPMVACEILLGLQQRTRQGVKTSQAILRSICNDARSQQISTLDALTAPAGRGQTYRSVVNTLITHARRGLSGPEIETAKDTWDLVLFGQRGRLPFTAISQPWLRQTAKTWAAADLPRRRGRSGGDKTRHHIASAALLSESLRQRPDRGNDPAELGRTDIEAFLGRLAFLHATGRISELSRVLACREVRQLLTGARQLGATRPGGPATGLSDQFAVRRDDIPDEPVHGEPGRDLPAQIMRQLCELLPTLAAPHIRTAIEVLIDTGRRPEDIVALPLDCLAVSSDGQPVLVYDNHKANRLGRRLPIQEATAQTIRAQQRRVQARFPDTPQTALKLLPTGWANREGRRALTVAGLSGAHHDWIDSLPPLLGHDGAEYDKTRIVLYAYPTHLRPTPRGRRRGHRRARRTTRSPQPERHPRLLPGRGRASPRSDRQGHRHAVRPSRHPDLAGRPRVARRRARPLHDQFGRSPVRLVHRTVERRRRRR